MTPSRRRPVEGDCSFTQHSRNHAAAAIGDVPWSVAVLVWANATGSGSQTQASTMTNRRKAVVSISSPLQVTGFVVERPLLARVVYPSLQGRQLREAYLKLATAGWHRRRVRPRGDRRDGPLNQRRRASSPRQRRRARRPPAAATPLLRGRRSCRRHCASAPVPRSRRATRRSAGIPPRR